MVECMECGKKLGVLEGYGHPVMGRKHLLCSPCFDQVSDSVAKWREFVASNSLNGKASYNFLESNWKNVLPSCFSLKKFFGNFDSDKEICMKN